MTDDHHHDRTSSLRLRLWIDGQLRDQVWINAGDPDAAARIDRATTTHDAAVDQANALGLPWMIEVWNPELPEAEAFLRFGTDDGGMVAPEPINEWPS
jgi:hypothetical protein